MKKTIAVVAAALCVVSALPGAAAAKNLDLDIGAAVPVYIPVSDFGKLTSVGTGILAGATYNFTDIVGGRAQVGFVHHFENLVSLNVVPIFLGVEATFGHGQIKPFADLDLCLNIVSASVGGSDSNIGMDIGGGVKYGLDKHLDVVGKLSLVDYDLANFTDTMNVGLTIGISYSL